MVKVLIKVGENIYWQLTVKLHPFILKYGSVIKLHNFSVNYHSKVHTKEP